MQLGLTRDDLGQNSGSDQKQIWRYEKNKTIPSAEMIVSLARALETTTDWILGLTDEIRPIMGDSSLDAAEMELLRVYRAKSPDQQDTILRMVRAV